MIEIEQKLLNRGLKPTAMRILVLEKLISSQYAISLGGLEELLIRSDKSTIYRTLKTFESALLVHSVEDGSGKTKYAICPDYCECNISELHAHFYCQSCTHTYCLPSVPVPSVTIPIGFTANLANLIVKGVCNNCN